MFTTYYFYDVFLAIKSTLQSEVGLSNAEYGLMVGAYSFANSFLLMAILGKASYIEEKIGQMDMLLLTYSESGFDPGFT